MSPTIIDDHGLPLISIADEDPEEEVLRRLAVLPPPSAYAIDAGSRNDVAGLEAARLAVAIMVERLIRRGARRIRRGLGW